MNDGETQHHIAYVRDCDLTDDQPWMFAEHEGALWFVVREHHTAQQLEDAWTAYRCIA